ncbi:MAG TPA: hypothetical protein VGC09_19665 [Rhodopila sp.]
MANFNWTTGTSGDWTAAANWTPATVPNDPAADVTIDAPSTAAYTVTIHSTDSVTVNSLTMNGVVGLAGSNQNPYNAGALELDGTLTFAPGSAGTLGGSLQTVVVMNGGTIINPGTVNGFIQAQGTVLLTGTNGFYVTNWLQSLAGAVTIDTKSIAEMTGSTLFDGIYEAKGTGGFIDLGGPRQNLIVNIATVVGPPLIPEGWTELILDGPGTSINEWNGTSYVGLETTLNTIGSRGTVDVTEGRDYSTTNTLTVLAGGLLNLQAGTFASGGIDINGGVVQGSGVIASGVTNDGTLTAVGGLMNVTSGLTGTGVVKFDFDQQAGTVSATGTMLHVNAVGSGQTFLMNGDDILSFGAPSEFAGTISAKAGDTLALPGVTITNATLTGQTLVLQNAGQTVASWQLAGSYAGDTFDVSNVSGGSVIKIGVVPPPNFAVQDTTTGTASMTSGTPYSGPVSGLQNEYVNITTDSLIITATAPNAFIHTGFGNDAIDVSRVNGANVLDGGGGANMLIGGSGNDTFFVDSPATTGSVASTIVNFHSGDNATIFGVDPAHYDMSVTDAVGAPGYQGVAIGFGTPGGGPSAFMVLAGYTSADLSNGRLIGSFATAADPSGGAGTPYFVIHAA